MICKKEPYIPMPEGRGFTAVPVRAVVKHAVVRSEKSQRKMEKPSS
jgi:hypothetical protein